MKIEDSSFNGWLLFLDTEGFAANNVSENYDAKIFAVSTLLSSQLLYNSVKIIDQSDVDYLELLARRTQLFALKAHMSPKKNWTSDFSTQLLQFPSLIWVIQDFVQETNGEACREWLLKLLSTHTRETEAYDISLKDIFPHVDCHTLFIPCAKKDLLTDLSLTTDADLIEEYKLERNQLLAKIKSNIEPKMRNNQPFTGADVAMLLRVLVDAANSGSLTDIPNRWETFLDKLQKSSVEECFKFYQSCMDFFVTEQNRNEAVNGGDLKETHSRSKAKTLNLLHHLLTGLEKSIGKSKQELFEKIDNSFSIISQLNEQKIEMKIFNLKKSYELKISDSFLTLKLPRLSSEIGQFGNGLEKEYTQAFVSDLTYLVGKEKLSNEVKSLSEFVSLNIDSTKMKNFQILEKKFDEIIANIDAEVIGSAQVNTETPFTFKRLEEYVSKLMQKTVSSFKNEASEYIAEKSVYDGKFYQLVTGINEKIALFRADNVNAVRQFLFKQADSFLEDFNRQTEQSRANFPMRFEDLDSFLERKFHKTKTIFATDFKDYSDYPVFADAIDKLNKEIEKICGSRRGENLQAFKLEVEQPLAFAKKSILLSKSKYSSLFCFRKFVSLYILFLLISNHSLLDYRLKFATSERGKGEKLATELEAKDNRFVCRR